MGLFNYRSKKGDNEPTPLKQHKASNTLAEMLKETHDPSPEHDVIVPYNNFSEYHSKQSNNEDSVTTVKISTNYYDDEAKKITNEILGINSSNDLDLEAQITRKQNLITQLIGEKNFKEANEEQEALNQLEQELKNIKEKNIKEKTNQSNKNIEGNKQQIIVESQKENSNQQFDLPKPPLSNEELASAKQNNQSVANNDKLNLTSNVETNEMAKKQSSNEMSSVQKELDEEFNSSMEDINLEKRIQDQLDKIKNHDSNSFAYILRELENETKKEEATDKELSKMNNDLGNNLPSNNLTIPVIDPIFNIQDTLTFDNNLLNDLRGIRITRDRIMIADVNGNITYIVPRQTNISADELISYLFINNNFAIICHQLEEWLANKPNIVKNEMLGISERFIIKH